MPALVPVRVTFDGGDREGMPVVDALHDPSARWNGFVVPLVARSAVDDLFSTCHAWGGDIEWSYEADGTLVLVDYPGTADECVTRIAPDAEGAYRLDIGWTFEEAE